MTASGSGWSGAGARRKKEEPKIATCGHHYPIEGCTNCWKWLGEWKDELCREVDFHEAVLVRLIAMGAVTSDQVDAIGEELSGIEHPARYLHEVHKERDGLAKRIEVLQHAIEALWALREDNDKARREAFQLLHDELCLYKEQRDRAWKALRQIEKLPNARLANAWHLARRGLGENE